MGCQLFESMAVVRPALGDSEELVGPEVVRVLEDHLSDQHLGVRAEQVDDRIAPEPLQVVETQDHLWEEWQEPVHLGVERDELPSVGHDVSQRPGLHRADQVESTVVHDLGDGRLPGADGLVGREPAGSEVHVRRPNDVELLVVGALTGSQLGTQCGDDLRGLAGVDDADALVARRQTGVEERRPGWRHAQRRLDTCRRCEPPGELRCPPHRCRDQRPSDPPQG